MRRSDRIRCNIASKSSRNSTIASKDMPWCHCERNRPIISGNHTLCASPEAMPAYCSAAPICLGRPSRPPKRSSMFARIRNDNSSVLFLIGPTVRYSPLGSMPIRSFTAERMRWLEPRYRSVVWIETWLSRNCTPAPVRLLLSDTDARRYFSGHAGRACRSRPSLRTHGRHARPPSRSYSYPKPAQLWFTPAARSGSRRPQSAAS